MITFGRQGSLPVLGIDWGTTNRRAYVLDSQGNVVRQHNDEMGILAVQGNFEASLQTLLSRLELEQADVIMSGMVGSRNGWREVPYLEADYRIMDLPRAMVEVENSLSDVRCRIVPGYRFIDRHGLPDVMRGEETQVLGALVLGAQDDGRFVLPGTHSKWVAIQDGLVSDLITFMTGEMYALLGKHGTLSNLMQERQDSPEAFEAGLSAAGEGGFTHMAFTCRALVVTGVMPAEHAASFLSGLLIGAELNEAGQRAVSKGNRQTVHVVGSETLEPRYRQALEHAGMPAKSWEPDQVYAAALKHLAGFNNIR
jgi:2-dehydro-3-deoxygalactonokinase